MMTKTKTKISGCQIKPRCHRRPLQWVVQFSVSPPFCGNNIHELFFRKLDWCTFPCICGVLDILHEGQFTKI